MANKVKQAAKELLSFKFVKETLAVYLFLMFVIYPLYYENKFYNMGEAKWNFFRTVTYYVTTPLGLTIPTFLVLLVLFFIWYQLDLYRTRELKRFWDPKKCSVTDCFVLAYLIVNLISTIISPYKDYILWGYDGWYMGLIAQVAFVLLYFFMSRFWRWDDIMMILYLAVSAVVYLFGVLNRFLIDPLEMYVDLPEQYIPQFLSTLGQSTWYSSYVVTIFPLGLFIYWYSEKKPIRIASFIYAVLGFMTLITQDSDSAFFAITAFISALFYFSFSNIKYMKRFLEILLIMLLSWRVIGFFQMAFPDQAVELGSLMIFGTQNPLLWIPILILAGLYVLVLKAEKKEEIDMGKFLWIRRLYFILMVVVLALVILYIALNTMGKLPESLSNRTNWYLYFDEFWGNNRGSSWTITIQSFFDCLQNDPLRAIFGAGPDGFYNTVYTYHAQELIEKWGENTVLTCAHNEFMTQFINLGILGGIAYLGIFLGGIRRFVKMVKKCPVLIAPVMCIVSYMAHNFFCYQQIICTPIIFIIIGGGESIARLGVLRPIYEEN